jgi:hypothetical protein
MLYVVCHSGGWGRYDDPFRVFCFPTTFGTCGPATVDLVLILPYPAYFPKRGPMFYLAQFIPTRLHSSPATFENTRHLLSRMQRGISPICACIVCAMMRAPLNTGATTLWAPIV